ncbi:hypothetical protein BC826DRAFT_1030986 [Russula brevipes]|nr:hypothetical protein BC826DRAFT_1030986 [Russula brevipes]
MPSSMINTLKRVAIITFSVWILTLGFKASAQFSRLLIDGPGSQCASQCGRGVVRRVLRNGPIQHSRAPGMCLDPYFDLRIRKTWEKKKKKRGRAITFTLQTVLTSYNTPV